MMERLEQVEIFNLHTAQVITQEHKLHDNSKVPCDRFNVQFRLQRGSPNRGHKKAADTHHFIFFHVQPANQQPTITSADLCHKNVGRPWFTETRVTRFQPFLSVHNARFHSECHTNEKAATKHVKITSFPLGIYSTLKFTYVIKYIRRPHRVTQTE